MQMPATLDSKLADSQSPMMLHTVDCGICRESLKMSSTKMMIDYNKTLCLSCRRCLVIQCNLAYRGKRQQADESFWVVAIYPISNSKPHCSCGKRIWQGAAHVEWQVKLQSRD